MLTKNILLSLCLIIIVTSCKKQMESVSDVVVIGGGLMGSSAGWHIAKEGLSVLLLEMQDSIYTHGSSYGKARIARSSNRGSDIWSFLHNKSLVETKILIDFLNSSEGEDSYFLNDVYTTSPVTYVGKTKIYESLYASLQRQKVIYDMAVTFEEGKSNYGVILPDSVLIQREYNEYSGIMNPASLIKLLHKGIRKKGSNIKYNVKVTDIYFDEIRNTYKIEIINTKNSTKECLYTKKIVSAAGPYTGQMLIKIAPYFQDLINPQRVFLAFLKIKKETYSKLNAVQQKKLLTFYPVINSAKGTRKGSFFSMIEYYEEGLPVIKIGGHFQRTNIENLDEVWKIGLTQKELEWSVNSTIDYMKLLDLPIGKEDLEIVDGYSCVYSLTDSEVPLVTPIKSQDNTPNHSFVVMGGMSGVGAKGAMTYGLLAADAIREETDQTDSLYFGISEAMGFNRLMK